MKKILLTRVIQPIAKELLLKHFQVDENPKDQPLSKEELCRCVGEYDGILSTIPDVFNRDVLQNAKNLKVLSNYAAGLDNIDVEFAKSKGIAVYNLPDTVTESTADLTFALFLSLIRKIPEAKEYVLKGHWTRGWEPALFLGEELRGKTFGIVGFGKIGKAVARRALGFGLKVIVFNRSKITMDQEFEGKVKQVSWEELLKQSDYISIHVPLSSETKGLFDLKAMSQLAKQAILINMARGAIINPDDLIVALEKGYVRGAALDVTMPEPLPASHPLCKFENCLVIPHIGSATVECRNMMAKEAAENIIQYFSAKK